MLNIFIQTENHLVIKRESYIKLIEKLKVKILHNKISGHQANKTQ